MVVHTSANRAEAIVEMVRRRGNRGTIGTGRCRAAKVDKLIFYLSGPRGGEPVFYTAARSPASSDAIVRIYRTTSIISPHERVLNLSES